MEKSFKNNNFIIAPVMGNFIGAGLQNNNIFDIGSSRNRDNCLAPFVELKSLFLRNGVELNTVDINRSMNAKFEVHLDVQKRVDHNVPSYLILGESPQVFPINGNGKYLEKYRRIFTWRDDLVDGKKFIKIQLPNQFSSIQSAGQKSEKKLCCLIGSNKTLPKKILVDLYSERVRTIRWFESFAPQDFDLFGNDWNFPAAMPGINNRILHKIKKCLSKEGSVYFPSYKGVVASKVETMKNYRFSICYENIRDLPGYITEKIWDCFFAGCVPIYWGASNVTDYIPEDCFIDRRKFVHHADLYEFMVSMTDAEYIAYQERIAIFLSSDKSRSFSAEVFAETIVNTITRDLDLSVYGWISGGAN